MSYAECTVCCTGRSGRDTACQDFADEHESQNPGHKVKIHYEDSWYD